MTLSHLGVMFPDPRLRGRKQEWDEGRLGKFTPGNPGSVTVHSSASRAVDDMMNQFIFLEESFFTGQ